MTKSELRQDLVSGDWILFAPSRSKRPITGLISPVGPIGKHKVYKSKKNCPFKNVLKNHKPILLYGGGERDWETAIVENKYPAVIHYDGACSSRSRRGPYEYVAGVGHHDLVVTRDHDRNFVYLTRAQANQVFQAFRDRYLMFAKDPCLRYVSIFHNWGPTAGASVYHPHYQILAIPVVPPDVKHSLFGSRRYFEKHERCVYCDMLKYELKENKRIIYENENAIVFTPFASREPFELRVFPKKHLPYFENTLDTELEDIVDATQTALRRIEKKLRGPDYNFFIHTAPLKDKKKFGHYHWHVEIIPKTNISAGFELSTGIEINSVDPDEAARLLKKKIR